MTYIWFKSWSKEFIHPALDWTRNAWSDKLDSLLFDTPIISRVFSSQEAKSIFIRCERYCVRHNTNATYAPCQLCWWTNIAGQMNGEPTSSIFDCWHIIFCLTFSRVFSRLRMFGWCMRLVWQAQLNTQTISKLDHSNGLHYKQSRNGSNLDE